MTNDVTKDTVQKEMITQTTQYVQLHSNCEIKTTTADCSVSRRAAAAAVQLTPSVDDSCQSTAGEHATAQTTPGYQQTHIR